MPHHHSRLLRALGVSLLVGTTVGFAGTPATAAVGQHNNATSAEVPGYALSVQQKAVQSLAASTGATPAQALHHLQIQAASKKLATTLASRLGAQAAGYYLDPTTGEPVVDVLTQTAANTVRAAGATAQLVRHSSTDLLAAKASLDHLLAVRNTAWGIDPVTDQLVVTISSAAVPGPALTGLLTAVRALGDKATVHHISQPITQHELGGDTITAPHAPGVIDICSLGFHVTDGSQLFVLDVAHCLSDTSPWSDNDGNLIGPTYTYSSTSDYGLIENDSGVATDQVDLYNGSTQEITSAGYPAVGEAICKSGQTTQLTCGQVTSANETVDPSTGHATYDTIEGTAQGDEGDSGGPMFDGSTGYGMDSAGGGGMEYYTPILPALEEYGVSLVGSTGGPTA